MFLSNIYKMVFCCCPPFFQNIPLTLCHQHISQCNPTIVLVLSWDGWKCALKHVCDVVDASHTVAHGLPWRLDPVWPTEESEERWGGGRRGHSGQEKCWAGSRRWATICQIPSPVLEWLSLWLLLYTWSVSHLEAAQNWVDSLELLHPKHEIWGSYTFSTKN